MMHSFKVSFLFFKKFLKIFKRFDKFDIAAASLFLAAKVEETPRKLQHVIFVLFEILHKRKLDDKSEEYKRRADILVEHEVLINWKNFNKLF